MTRKTRIVYCGPEEALSALIATVGADASVEHVPPETDQVLAALRDADAYIDASMKVRLTRDNLAPATRLGAVGVAATGADHVDAAALADRDIPLLTLRGQTEVLRGLTPAAELSWMLLMACARQLPAARDHVLGGEWNRLLFPGIMLKGRTIGIIGCGRIGGWMARYATAFGMECLGYDPALEEFPPGVTAVPLEDLLQRSDFVTLHVPLMPSTSGMLDRRAIEVMKPGTVFINTSRGDLVDEDALLEALESGRVAAAGLDVLRGEPDVRENPLWRYAQDHPNVIITPHIGGFSPDAVRVVVSHTARRVLDHLATVRATS